MQPMDKIGCIAGDSALNQGVTTMTMFRTMVSVALLSLASASVCEAIDYREALKACGAEWKKSEARSQVKKGEGMVEWQKFRAECVKRQGYDGPKKGAAKTTAA